MIYDQICRSGVMSIHLFSQVVVFWWAADVAQEAGMRRYISQYPTFLKPPAHGIPSDALAGPLPLLPAISSGRPRHTQNGFFVLF